VIDVSRGVASRLTSDPADERDPVWSPDGQELAFSRRGSEGWDIFRQRLHRGEAAESLLESPAVKHPKDWTRDGETLLYNAVDQGGPSSSVWALPLAGDEGSEPVVEPVDKTRFRVGMPQLSPDDRWLAFRSNESGAWEVYVEPFARPGERLRVSVDGGTQPKWRGDGEELFYRTLVGALMAVKVSEEGERLEVGLPTELFDAGELGGGGSDHYAVSADGQRFLVKLPVEDDRKLQMHVVVNWESLLETEE
jgi:dipeptidyl aminopeptidase/acylaminoacyl peptidase